MPLFRTIRIWTASAALLGVLAFENSTCAEPLKVCTTVSDLGDLAHEVGGDEVRVVVFAKGAQDPHFVEPRPSFLKELSTADLFIQIGMELEIGWAPSLCENSRNGKVLPGNPGFLDAGASSGIAVREKPAGVVSRALGDVHPQGNPHYLLDPVSGIKVARAIRDRLSELRPEKREQFAKRFDDFAGRVAAGLVGKRLAAKYDVEKLAVAAEIGKLDDFLEKQGDAPIEGWLGRVKGFRGAPVVGDHNLWPYFAGRFGLKVEGFLEPKPGIAPTTSHLTALVEKMKSLGVKAILSSVYFDPRHARFASEHTGAAIIELAHQCGSRPGTDTYLEMVEYNVKQLESALGGKK